MGRLEKEKNWKHFLQIASSVSKKRDHLLFRIIGGYSAEEGVKKDFLANGVAAGSHRLPGVFPIPPIRPDARNSIFSIGASSGCLVTTSILEPFGMALIEAMACQSPAVRRRHG